jgi:uncharacterized protein YbaR (Trm112 family)
VFANMVLGMLRNAGIDCHIKDEYSVTIDPLIGPAIGGMKLMVEETNVSQALELLKEAEQRYLRSLPCPVCKEKNLQLMIKTTYYTSWYQKIKSRLINGQEGHVEQMYVCNSCHSKFKGLPGE